jgi:hypothetical protein
MLIPIWNKLIGKWIVIVDNKTYEFETEEEAGIFIDDVIANELADIIADGIK